MKKTPENVTVSIGAEDAKWLASLNIEIDRAVTARVAFVNYLYAKHQIPADRFTFRIETMKFEKRDQSAE